MGFVYGFVDCVVFEMGYEVDVVVVELVELWVIVVVLVKNYDGFWFEFLGLCYGNVGYIIFG